MNEIKYKILYRVFVRTFVIPFYYGSGTVFNYGSNILTNYGSDSSSTRKKSYISYGCGSGYGSGSTTPMISRYSS